MVRPKLISASALVDGQALDPKNIQAVSCQATLKVEPSSGYEIVSIKAGDNLQTEARKLVRSGKNLLVLVDNSFANSFGNLARLRSSQFKTNTSVVFLLTATSPVSYMIEVKQEITELKMANVVAYLPGKSKKEELVVFSGHYDHLGVGNQDTILQEA